MVVLLTVEEPPPPDDGMGDNDLSDADDLTPVTFRSSSESFLMDVVVVVSPPPTVVVVTATAAEEVSLTSLSRDPSSTSLLFVVVTLDCC